MKRRSPRFPGKPRKNDALFMYGALQPKPFVHVYEPQSIEVVHGPSCRPDDEIFLDRCKTDGVSVVERRSGGLAERGITGIARSGISDCAINGRKILGSSIYLGTNPPLFYYQSSLLVDPDMTLHAHALAKGWPVISLRHS